MDSESRMIEGYEVTHSVKLGIREVVMGQNWNAPKDERYMCALCHPSKGMVNYEVVVASDDFSEIAIIFAEYITAQALEVKRQRDLMVSQHIDPTPFTAKDCRLDSETESIEGEIVVIRASDIRPDYQISTSQLMLCTGGFGAKANARGTTVYGIDLYSGGHMECQRRSVLGTMERDALPDWAKNALSKIEHHRAEKQRGER